MPWRSRTVRHWPGAELDQQGPVTSAEQAGLDRVQAGALVDGSVVVVVVDVVVMVDGLGLVVVGAVVDEALGCGRVGSGSEVGLATRPDRDVVVAIRVASLVGASVRLPPTAVGPTLGSVVVGPATPTPESIVSGPTPTPCTVVPEEEVRSSAPVNSSQRGGQRSLWSASPKAALKARAAGTKIADTRTRRRLRQLRPSRGTAAATVLPPFSQSGFALRSWAPWGRRSPRRPAGSEAGGAGADAATATTSSPRENGRVSSVRLGSGGRSWLLSAGWRSRISGPR
jgi:hypothetical protein